jgi:hypothetical protein
VAAQNPETKLMKRADVLQRLEGLANAFNAHDLDRIMSYFSDKCTREMPRGSRSWGTKAEGGIDVRDLLAIRFKGIPDVHYGNISHFVDGMTGISKWTLTGTTHQGAKIEVNGCDFYPFDDDGLVIRKDSYWKIVE